MQSDNTKDDLCCALEVYVSLIFFLVSNLDMASK